MRLCASTYTLPTDQVARNRLVYTVLFEEVSPVETVQDRELGIRTSQWLDCLEDHADVVHWATLAARKALIRRICRQPLLLPHPSPRPDTGVSPAGWLLAGDTHLSLGVNREVGRV